jgi:predicted transcriptional regulator
MANAHITATLRCSKFKGTTRLVLLYLADAASPGPKIVDKRKTGLPLGYCKRRLSTIMAAVNSKRQPTVSAAIRELKKEGAIKQFLKKKDGTWQVPLYFVDLEWLKAHAYTDEELEKFGYETLKEKREDEKQAKKNSTDEPEHLDADDIFPNELIFRGKTPVSDPSATGKTSGTPVESTNDGVTSLALGAAYPLATSVSPAEQRKAFNGDNGNRLTVDTESVRPGYEKRLTDFPPVPTLGGI